MQLNGPNPEPSQWTEEELRASDDHIRENLAETHRFIESLMQHCPRSAVITGIARIDHELELVLRKVIDGDATIKEDRLFSPDRPRDRKLYFQQQWTEAVKFTFCRPLWHGRKRHLTPSCFLRLRQ